MAESIITEELNGCAVIREVHVYGPSLELSKESSGEAQHLGLGSKLIEKAKEIALDSGFNKLAVISSIGTREYYEKRGFKLFYIGKVKIVHIGGSSTKHVKDWIWQIKKRNAIRLEWLNLNLFQIVKYTFIHFGSAIFNNKPISKIKMLIKAYKENFNNLKEIKEKRRERNSWKK